MSDELWRRARRIPAHWGALHPDLVAAAATSVSPDTAAIAAAVRDSGCGLGGCAPRTTKGVLRKLRVRVQLIGHARNNMLVNLSHAWL